MIPAPFTGRLLRSAATACAAILTGLLGVSLGATPLTEMPAKVKLVADPSPAVPAPKASAFGLRVARNVGLPAPDLAEAIAEDSAVAAQSEAKAPRRIGIKRPIAPVEAADADWNVLPDGSRVWVGRFESAGAQGIRLHFSSVKLPAGAVLIAYDAAQPQFVEGPFDSAYLGGRDSFWSSTVFASSVVVEAHVPAGAGTAAFTVTEMTHNYRSTKSEEAKNAGACEHDFTCELTDWGTTGNAVSGIGAVAQNGSIFCTGCLLNDQNPAPGTDYYLTANHCITGQAQASTLEFYWLYQTPTCNGVEPNLATVPRTRGGADLLSNRARGTGTDMNDHSFLRLRGTVPAGVTYAGWSVNAPAAGEVITCIHHPDGDYKRISHGTINAPLSTANFWNILWTPGRGVTEPGSSGSPIFNAQKQVIGQLYGGPSGCANTNPADQNDDFGRFAITYTYIRPWLLNEAPPPPPTGPTNDLFATPRILTGASGSVAADSSNATHESGDPVIAGNAGGASLWFRWTAPAAGTVTFDTIGSGFDTLLGIFRGTALGALTVVGDNDDIASGNTASRVAFTAVAGTTYLIAVDGYNAVGGPVVLNWTGPVGPVLNNDNFANAVVITGATGQVNGSNTNYTREAGEPTHQPAGFPATDVGQRSAWWTWTAPASGQVTFDTVGSSFDTVLAVYTGSAVGSLTPVAQNDDVNSSNLVSRVTFAAVAGTTYRIAVDGYRDAGPPVDQAEGSIVLNWSGATPPPPPTGNDNFTNAIVITGAAGRATGSNTNYTRETGEPTHQPAGFPAANLGQRSAWWTWTAPAAGPVTFDTVGSSFDTVLAVYTGSAVGSLAQVAQNDDLTSSDFVSRVTFTATAGTVYRIAVDGYRTSTGAQRQGAIVLNWSGATPPPPPTGNDNFTNAIVITGAAGRATGSNTNYTRETGEPTHQPAGFPADEVGQRSAWWTWTAPASGQVTFDTAGSSFDSVLAVYTGSAIGSLTQIAQNDDIDFNGGVYQSRVTFAAVAGTVYRIAVDGYRDAGPPVVQEEGAIVLNWSGATPPPPPTGNDNFTNAIVITGLSGSVTGSNTNYTHEAGEPDHDGNANTSSAWWRWTASTNGTVTFTTAGSSFDTILAVYTGTAVNALTAVASNDDVSDSDTTSALSFQAVSGTTYQIAVDGYRSTAGVQARGNIVLNWTTAGGGGGGGSGKPDLVVWTPSLLPALEFRTFAAGDCAVNEGCGIVGRRRLLTFDTEVRNQGTADVRLGVPGPSNTNFLFDPCHGHYHWLGYAHYRLVGTNGVVATGRKVGFCLLDSIHWSTTNGPSTSRYDCQNQGISVGWGDVYGRHLSCQYVDVTDVPDGDYFLEVEVDPNNQFDELDESNNVGRVPVRIGPVVTPANDDFISARVIHLATGLVHGNSAGASSQPGEPTTGAGATVWFRWTAPCTGTAVFDTEGTPFDTVIAAYSGSTVGGLTRLAINDDSGTGNWSRITFAATTGTEYSIAVDGYSPSDAGPFRLRWVIEGGSCPITPRPLPVERPSAVGAFTVDFFGETGETYAMDVTESLSSPWIRLLTTTGEGRQMTFTDNSANQHSSRYYRIVQVNP